MTAASSPPWTVKVSCLRSTTVSSASTLNLPPGGVGLRLTEIDVHADGLFADLQVPVYGAHATW
jgi:hypothetical protein